MAPKTLKAKYLPKMVSGEWTGSMQLTEPHAGSDLRFLKTRAVPQGDGTYRISGTKIFITFGDHPLTENIIHIVLARLPDAPLGTKGISMFLVPKFLVNDDGSLGARNDVRCAKLEHKLGIHGSPTCVLNYGDEGGAVGWIIGEPNRGLQYMFTMMNQARLGVGVQGVGLAEHAFQDALAYARDRKQGSTETTAENDMTPIINHPDVRRMLISMKAKIAAARAICATNAVAIDIAKHGSDEATRAKADALAALLTPISKSFGSDIAVEVASEGIQVHGGMGFIEETGAAQHYRDARIAPIYEGTNGIQCVDLVGRKLPMNGGETVRGVHRRVEGDRRPGSGIERARLRRDGRMPGRRRRRSGGNHRLDAAQARRGAKSRLCGCDDLWPPVRADGGRRVPGARSAGRGARGEWRGQRISPSPGTLPRPRCR